MSWCVVVPTNRPDRIQDFIEAWEPLFKQHRVVPVFVQDSPEDFIGGDWRRFCWADIPDWIPRRADMIRSWGIYEAWKLGATYTLSLDDDTLPDGDLFAAYEQVFRDGAPLSPYLDVGSLTSYGKPMRGFPFADRKPATVAAQYGGWHGVLDYDAPTQLAGVGEGESFHPVVLPVPKGVPVTGCIMNCAWRTEYAPIMWQLPLIAGKYNRFGDIWSGLFQKKTLDALGKAMVINGRASVRHERASDPLANLAREAPGIPINEGLWAALDGEVEGDMLDVYRTVTRRAWLHFVNENAGAEYTRGFIQARDSWLALF